MQIEPLRAALHSLYHSSNSEERQAADTWLRSFASQDGAWQQVLSLLSDPAAGEHGSFFAATALSHACQKHQGPLEKATLSTLAPLLAQQLAAATEARSWHIGNQLAVALATLAVRSHSWPVEQVVPELLGLAQAALGNASVSAEQQQLMQLRLLTVLAESVSSNASMHPQRRADVRAALAAALQPLAAVQQAFSLGSPSAVQAAALQLLQAWCSLGRPPAGSQRGTALWQQLHSLALQPDQLGSAAAETLATLYAACLNASASETSQADQQALQYAQMLLYDLLSLLPSFASQLQLALSQAHTQQRQAQLLFAALTVVGAAAKAAESWAGAVPAAAAAEAVQLAAEVGLAALQQPDFDVTLAGLQLWDEQLDRWQQQQQSNSKNGGSLGPCSLSQRQALLARLCGALLQRMALPAGLPASACTADARDLPAAVLRARREAADTFRLAADCLGPAQARRQLLQLASEAQAAGDAVQQECCLYALNVIWSRQRTQQQNHHQQQQCQQPNQQQQCQKPNQQQQQQQQDEAGEVLQAAAAVAAALQPHAPKLAGTALTLLGGMAGQLPLLLAAGDQSSQQPGSSQQGGQLLAYLLNQLVQLVRLPHDEKLSRNAATCCYRLTSSPQLAGLLAREHRGWGDALCGCFAAIDGMTQRAQQGEDLTTAQLLLVSVCHLATAAAAPPGEAAGLLKQLLSQPATAADASLAAAAASPAGSEQQLAHLERAAVQVEAIAVALEAVAGRQASTSAGHDGDGDSQAQSLLPGLLSSFEGVLQHAAAAAAAAAACSMASQQMAGRDTQQQQQHFLLLQAVCRVAAAVAPTPAASRGLQLLQLFVADPRHPCVLHTLTQLALVSDSRGDATSSQQQLQAAAAGSLQAAAAQHGSDPEWQPAVLALGEACLQRLPAVLADGGALQALLTTAQHSMRSWHREPAEQVVGLAEALCCVGCTARRHSRPASGSGGSGGGGGADSAGPGPGPAQLSPAHRSLQQCLDSGLGAQLVLGLLLAASGAMPPYMVVQISDALHRTWLAVGTERFGAWLREAALQLAPEGGAPWRRWKPEAQASAVGELLSPLCAQDARRFKRLLKVFCGGKKSGRHVDQPARSGT